MFSDSDTFKIEHEHVRYDLSQPANSNVPFIIDVKEQQVIIVDYNSRQRLGLTAHAEVENLKALISATKDKHNLSIEDLADLLSGDSNTVSATIVEKKDKNSSTPQFEPDDLAKIFV